MLLSPAGTTCPHSCKALLAFHPEMCFPPLVQGSSRADRKSHLFVTGGMAILGIWMPLLTSTLLARDKGKSGPLEFLPQKLQDPRITRALKIFACELPACIESIWSAGRTNKRKLATQPHADDSCVSQQSSSSSKKQFSVHQHPSYFQHSRGMETA